MESVLNSKYLIYIQPQAQSVPTTTPAAQQPSKLKIFYTNDWHGQTDNMGGILGASLQFDSSAKGKNFDTLKLVAGDTWSGANIKKNNMIVNLMNYMKFDASTIGNHELDAGTAAMQQMVNNSKGTKFISANLKTNNDQKLPGIDGSLIKEVNGNKYGIIGLSPIDLKTVVAVEKIPDLDVEGFEQTVQSAQKEIDNLRAQGVNKIILLSHIGKDLDEKIAPRLDGVDVIVGGHSHDKIEGVQEGQNLVRSKSGEPVVILQTGQNAENYGILDVDFDADGLLTSVANSVIETPRTKNDIIEKIKDDEVGVSPQIGYIKEIQPFGENRKIEPNAWTAFMIDTVRAALDTDVALINSANIRKVPKIGKLTQTDVEESAPMKNSLIKTTMSEEQIVNAIKNAAYRSLGAVDGYPGLLQCSGIKYKIDSNGKLLNISFVDKNGKETIVDPEHPSSTKMYSVALDSFLGNGKEYPEMLPTQPVETFDYDKDTTTVNYIKNMKDKDNLVIKDDGRLQIVQTSEPRREGNNTRNI